MNQFFKDCGDVFNRLSKPTPLIFKKARRLGMIMTAGGGAAIKGFHDPHILVVATVAASIGGTIIAVASVACDDSAEVKTTENK
jgi:hypothetical protein